MTEAEVQAYVQRFGLREVTFAEQVPNVPMAYVVTQAADVLAVGMSKSSQRLRSLMGESSLHKKKALISLCAHLRPDRPIRFHFKETTTGAAATALETELMQTLGEGLGVASTSTSVDGVTGYSRAMHHLLGQSQRPFSDREQDLIELVVANGDIFCSLLKLDRFRETTLGIFGDYYVRPPEIRAPRPPPEVRLAQPEAGRPLPVTNTVAAAPEAAVSGFWHEASAHYWRFRREDWTALQRPNCLGFRLHIRGPFARRWANGEVVVEVPRNGGGRAWEHLEHLAQLPSFRHRGINTSSSNVPRELHGYVRPVR